MRYKKASNEDLKRCKYPNLIAELIESGYSICTLSEHMGHGRTKEDDPEVWGKIRGEQEIDISEAYGLARLFGVEIKYLFDNELHIMCGVPVAVIRWYDWNKKMKESESITEVTA